MSRSNSPALRAPQLGGVRTDWLQDLISSVKVAGGVAELAPFPYINPTVSSVVAVLEAIQKVKKNKDDLKDLADDIADVVRFVGHELAANGDVPASRFTELCQEYINNLNSVVDKLSVPSIPFSDRQAENFSSCISALPQQRRQGWLVFSWDSTSDAQLIPLWSQSRV